MADIQTTQALMGGAALMTEIDDIEELAPI